MNNSHQHLHSAVNSAALNSLPQQIKLPETIQPMPTHDQRWVIAIVVATVTYQALICMFNTQFRVASASLVGLAEAVILLACLPFLARRLLPGVIIIAALAGAILCLLTLVSGELNVKAFRDLLIPLSYFWLGCNIGRPALADRALTYAITIVLSLGLMELLFLDQYTEIFDIFAYYVNIGKLNPITDYIRESRLQLNGIRPEGIGRTLLPGLLGSHRVSSVFLEPVSLGNFATICAAWGLSKERIEWRQTLYFVGIAIVLIVLSDSRFALIAVSLMIAMRLAVDGKALYLALLGPFIAIVALLFIGYETAGRGEDNFHDRLALSGRSLLNFDMQALLGVTPHENFADQGYAYVIATFGVPICLLLWFSFWFLSMSDERGQRFRAFASIYITLILCVSGFSLFALKTSGLLWFLVGCSLKNPAPLFQPMGTRKPTAAPYKLTAAFYKPTVLPSKLTPLKPTTASTPIKAFTSGPVPPAMSAKTESFTSRKHVD